MEDKIHRRRMRERGGRIPATEAAKNFGRLVDRVREEQAVYVIERGGKPVARIGPVERIGCTLGELARFLTSTRPLDSQTLRSIEQGVKRLNRPSVPKNPWAR